LRGRALTLTDLRFLAVEDHEFQRRMLVRILTSLQVSHVATAPDGRAALEIVRASLLPGEGAPIDIIISDLDMPGMDGMEFMRHLGEARVAASIILTSALDRSLLASVETMAREYGVKILGVIEKPVTPAKLDALIRLHRPAAADALAKGACPSFSLEEILEGLTRGEFEPFFQPKVEVSTGRLRGAESLARWRHPEQGVVPPCGFIPILEAAGRIDDLTWVMLARSAAFWKGMHAAEGADLTLSVNLSVRSLGNVHLADRVTELVRAEKLDPRRVILEVTESATTSEMGRTLENLSRLRMKGFGLSIDDYGTGYSSMQQLARIAFTELKVDQSFVTNSSKQPATRVILESSLDMAKKLKMVSVAEGVETQEDWDVLLSLGCQLAQGYFIARPMKAADFSGWVEARERSLAAP
jgi:EAL domain-containing protein (putative c-di-GMP-specific phosphodiesterase class I)/AmiR/NasT family two-component response regulator